MRRSRVSFLSPGIDKDFRSNNPVSREYGMSKQEHFFQNSERRKAFSYLKRRARRIAAKAMAAASGAPASRLFPAPRQEQSPSRDGASLGMILGLLADIACAP